MTAGGVAKFVDYRNVNLVDRQSSTNRALLQAVRHLCSRIAMTGAFAETSTLLQGIFDRMISFQFGGGLTTTVHWLCGTATNFVVLYRP